MLVGQPGRILTQTRLLFLHFCSFAVIQSVPDTLNEYLSRASLVIAPLDSFSKCKQIMSGVDSAIHLKTSPIFAKLILGWLSSQFGKYVFERFLIPTTRPAEISMKTCAIAASILLYASEIPRAYKFERSVLLATMTLLVFFGTMLDRHWTPQTRVGARMRPGSKLRRDAKT